MRGSVIGSLLAAGFIAVSSWSCGGSGDQCGPGTVQQGTTCVPRCGAGTALAGGACAVAAAACAQGTVLSEASHTCVTAQAAFDAAPTPWSANLQVSPAGMWGAEPSVAIDSQGHLYVAAMIQPTAAAGQTTATLFTSNDEGKTWSTLVAQETKLGGFTGDVSVAVDSADTIYFAYIDYGHTADPVSGYPPGNVWVQASTDHGATFQAVKVNQDNGSYFCDRPWLHAGPNDEMLLSFTYDLGNTQGLPEFHSTDHGASWTFLGDIAQSLSARRVYTDGQFPTTRTATSYLLPRVTYENYMTGTPDVYLDLYRTSDFATYHQTRIAKIFTSRDLTVDTMAVPAVGPKGEVYVAYINASSRNLDLDFVRSTDDGATFSAPVSMAAVDPAATQAMPWMAVDQTTGAVNAMYIDNHTGEWMVVGARSTDGGQTFELSRVSDKTFVEDSSQTKWLGDFNAVAVGAGKTCAVWTDTRGGESAIYLSCRQG